jgi:hypothetical protein
MQTLVYLVKVTNKINEGKGLFTHPISQSDFAVQSYLDTKTIRTLPFMWLHSKGNHQTLPQILDWGRTITEIFPFTGLHSKGRHLTVPSNIRLG